MFFENCVSEIFEDVGQEKNVGKQIVIVIILERFPVVNEPKFVLPDRNLLGRGLRRLAYCKRLNVNENNYTVATYLRHY